MCVWGGLPSLNSGELGATWYQGKVTHFVVLQHCGWGLPPQRGDQVEDTIGSGEVGGLDSEGLLWLVAVRVRVLLLRGTHCSRCWPDPKPGPALPDDPLTRKRLKMTVICCPASVHNLRAFWVLGSSSKCCPAMTCCRQSCRAREACGHQRLSALGTSILLQWATLSNQRRGKGPPRPVCGNAQRVEGGKGQGLTFTLLEGS